MNLKHLSVRYSRRDFGKLSLASLSTAALMTPADMLASAPQSKPNSVFGGVPIGAITPYSFGAEATTAGDILKALITVGLSRAEIGNAAVEAFAGAPTPAPAGARANPPAPSSPAAARGGEGQAQGQGGGRRGGGRAPLTPEQQAAQQAAAQALAAWRATAPLDRIATLRRTYDEAGVTIAAFRITLTAAMTDVEYDYAFNAAKALGASSVTMELPSDSAVSQRIGQFATKHQTMVGYHLHTTATMTAWDQALAQSRHNGIQLDIGHYVAGTSESPIPFMQKHHARITSLHLKDRKRANNTGVNMPWGQGDTPVAEVLQLMKKEGWRFPAFIELEYPVPEGSTRVAEVAKCLAFARNALA